MNTGLRNIARICSVAATLTTAAWFAPTGYEPVRSALASSLDDSPVFGPAPWILHTQPVISINNGMVRKLFDVGFPKVKNLDLGLELVKPGALGLKPDYDKRLYFDFMPVVFGDSQQRLFFQLNGERRFSRFPKDSVAHAAGLGYRRIVGDSLLLGANAFIDIDWRGGLPRGSWGWGIETAYSPFGSAAVEMNVNRYGNPFLPGDPRDLIRVEGNAGWEFEIGFRKSDLFDLLGVRVRAGEHRFGADGPWGRGRKVGIDLWAPGEAVRLSYEYGLHDSRGPNHLFMAAVNLDFRPDLILEGGNPFSFPKWAPKSSVVKTIRDFLRRKVMRKGPEGPLWQ